MFAVLELPNFALQSLLRLHPELRNVPVGVLRGEGRRALVTETNPLDAYLRAGTSAAQALADCPDLRLVTPQPDAEREADALLLSAAWALSPRVEPTAPGRCTIDLAGTDPLRIPQQCVQVCEGLARHDLSARIGIGPTPLVARYATHDAQPVHHVADSSHFLAKLPVSILELTDDEAQLLKDLGLRTLGSITAFPRAAFANRLGQRGDEIWSRAAGEWHAPVQAAPFPTRHLATLELEEAVETLEPLLFTLRRFCERLATEVGQFGGGTNRLTLELTLETESTHRRDFALPEPTAKPDVLFAVLENHLASLQTDAAITGISLEAFPARRLEQQEGFFDTGLKDAPMFYATLGRLAAVVGSDCVGTPHRRDTHRPDVITLSSPPAMVPERHSPAAPEPHGPLLRRFRPPIPATVELTHSRPTYLASPVATGPITTVRRAFRANGDWWSADTWAREEWDIQVNSGLYRLLHEPTGWFVEGLYD